MSLLQLLQSSSAVLLPAEGQGRRPLGCGHPTFWRQTQSVPKESAFREQEPPTPLETSRFPFSGVPGLSSGATPNARLMAGREGSGREQTRPSPHFLAAHSSPQAAGVCGPGKGSAHPLPCVLR